MRIYVKNSNHETLGYYEFSEESTIDVGMVDALRMRDFDDGSYVEPEFEEGSAIGEVTDNDKWKAELIDSIHERGWFVQVVEGNIIICTNIYEVPIRFSNWSEVEAFLKEATH